MSEDEAPGAGAGTEPEGAFEAPRDPQHTHPTDEQVAAAAADARADERWHKNGADVVAVQLQIGRGRSKEDVAETFKVGLSTVTHWVSRRKWTPRLGEARRRALSWRVMLAGYVRLCDGEDVDFENLRRTAEWRALPQAKPARPAPRQDFGAFIGTGARAGAQQINTDNGNDGRDEADPHRDTRNYFRRRLDEIIAELNATAARRAEQARAGEMDRGDGNAEDPGRG